MAPDRHLDILTAPALAGRLGISLPSLHRRTDLPPPLLLGGKKVWFLNEVSHLLRREQYEDRVTAPALASLLGFGVAQVYRLVQSGTLPEPRRHGGRSTWSRRDVEHHLKALRRGS